MTTPKNAKRRLTREDWVAAATKRLIKKSIDAVRIESLADEIGVSRGSFYWHFKSRADLLAAILSAWRERQTRRIMIGIRSDQSLSPDERVIRLRSLPARTKNAREGAALELAIRDWARRDKSARLVVEAVDRERIAFVSGLFVDSGMGKEVAAEWALISYAYTVGEALIRDQMTDEQIAACRKRILALQFAEAKRKQAGGGGRRTAAGGKGD